MEVQCHWSAMQQATVSLLPCADDADKILWLSYFCDAKQKKNRQKDRKMNALRKIYI